MFFEFKYQMNLKQHHPYGLGKRIKNGSKNKNTNIVNEIIHNDVST